MKRILNYFLKGLLIVFPVFATLTVIVNAVLWANRRLNSLLFEWLSVDIPGLGILSVFLALVALGFLFTRAFSRPFLGLIEGLFVRTPLVKILYTALKDLTEAFVGERKRFSNPVLVEIQPGVKRLGFVTEENLQRLDLDGHIAVYCPHSYNFSGNLYFVSRERIRPVALGTTDALKYVVSAGITQLGSGEDRQPAQQQPDPTRLPAQESADARSDSGSAGQ